MLLDSTMPGMDGPTVLERLRADPSTRTLPVIMVTGNAAPAERVQGLGLGADDFIAKPVLLDELVARVRSQLRLHAAWRARIDEELRERRAIAAAGRRVQVRSSPEVTAASFVAELTQALDLAGMAIVVFTRAGAVALASSGEFRGEFPPGHLLDRITGASVRRRVGSGGRVDLGGTAGRDDRRRLERYWLPLRGGDQVQGALAVATEADSSDLETGAAARAIERFAAVADLAVTLLPAAIEDYAALQLVLDSLGPTTSVAVDDAGSGYASLEHILRLRPALVKLDIAWVRGIESDPARKAIVAGLVHFARETGCQVVAEGIETEAERVALEALGVGLGQGYLLGRPRPARTVGGGADHDAPGGAAGPTVSTLH